jgi:hypothetical protein
VSDVDLAALATAIRDSYHAIPFPMGRPQALAVAALIEAAEKRIASGHSAICARLYGTATDYPDCDCGHDALAAALGRGK